MPRATGAVTTAPDTSSWVGGLFGYNNGSTITDVHATAAVSGSNTGGLAGVNFGTIADAYATGAVSSGGATSKRGRPGVGIAGGDSQRGVVNDATVSRLCEKPARDLSEAALYLYISEA